jgi:hypothetical protein
VTDLRPRTIVELVDRTVSIAGQYFVPLFLIALLTEGVLGLSSYADPANRDAFDYVSKTHAPRVVAGAGFHGWTWWRILWEAVNALEATALIVAVAGLVRRGRVEFFPALQGAVRRYPAALLVWVVYSLLAQGVSFVTNPIVRAAELKELLGGGMGAVLGWSVALGVVYAVIHASSFVAVAAAALEPIGPIRAALRPLRLFSNGARALRMLAATGVVFLFEVMQELGQGAAAALIAPTIHSRVVYSAVATAIGCTESVLAMTFIALFYYDTRVRYDALDIQLALETR